VKSLFAKLSLVFLSILLILGFATLWLTHRSSQNYILEFTQKLNRPIAMYMAENINWVVDGKLDSSALTALSPHIMMINPTVSVYLVDTTGAVVSDFTGSDTIKPTIVDMTSVNHFLSEDSTLPLLGTDPVKQNERSIFSVWPIYADNKIQPKTDSSEQPLGYVYVVLGNEKHNSLLASIRENYSIQDMLLTLVGVLTLTMVAGLIIFFMLTRRLRLLTLHIRQWRTNGLRTLNSNHLLSARGLPHSFARGRGDEIDFLRVTYENMTTELLEQYHKLERGDSSRREFIANISHDLRTPLTSLQNYVETLLVKWDTLESQEKHQFLVNADRQTKRLKHLVSQLFEVSKLNSPDLKLHPERFSILELVYDCVQDFTLHAEKRQVALSVDVAHDNFSFFEVYADIALIQRALENILTNALRHTPAGGNIKIRLDKTSDSKPRITIENTGTGLSMDQLDSFARTGIIEATEPQKGGSGFGLSIVQRILSLHNSSLQLRNTCLESTSTGTSFYFTLDSDSNVSTTKDDEPLLEMA